MVDSGFEVTYIFQAAPVISPLRVHALIFEWDEEKEKEKEKKIENEALWTLRQVGVQAFTCDRIQKYCISSETSFLKFESGLYVRVYRYVMHSYTAPNAMEEKSPEAIGFHMKLTQRGKMISMISNENIMLGNVVWCGVGGVYGNVQGGDLS